MIRSITFHPEHMRMFKPTEVFLGEVEFNSAPRDMTYAHTLLDDDTMLGCVGGRKLWNGVGEVWAIFSHAIYKHPLRFTRAVAECLDFYEKELKLHRMQAYVRVGYPMAVRWAEALGFRSEGVMKKFGADGADYYVMGRVK